VDSKPAILMSSPEVVAGRSRAPIPVALPKDAPIVAPPVTVPSAALRKRAPVENSENTLVVQVVASPQAQVATLRRPT